MPSPLSARPVTSMKRSLTKLKESCGKEIYSLQLRRAIVEDNYEKCVELIENNDINLNGHPTVVVGRGGRGWSFLHHAADHGNVDIVVLLVQHGAYVNQMNHSRRTPLHKAAQRGHAACVMKLLQFGSNVYARDENNFTPYDIAKASGHANIAKILKGAETNAKETFNVDLKIACMSGNTERVEIMLREEGYNPDAGDPLNSNFTYLHYAACNDQPRVIEKLLFSGAKTVSNNEGDSPLHVAAYYGNLGCVEKLLPFCGVNDPNKDGRTPLFWAVRYGDFELVETLLQAGALVNVVDATDLTPLGIALKRGNHGLQKLLEEYSEKEEANSETSAFVSPSIRGTTVSAARLRSPTMSPHINHKLSLLPPMPASPGLAPASPRTPRNTSTASHDIDDERYRMELQFRIESLYARLELAEEDLKTRLSALSKRG
eukprot:Rmarinus@m.29892